jgi:hypothetical protein
MTEAQIKHMVDRFLAWKLPPTFCPDGGVTFEPVGNAGSRNEYKREPAGTNLLDAIQAEAMIRHMLEGMPSAKEDRPCTCGGRRWVNDENWEPRYADLPQERIQGDGLIPCGFCNFAGWDTALNEPD